jgi:hypothetical protein
MGLLNIIGALASLGLGLFGLFNPKGAARLVGIAIVPELPHSISEVRATYGGLFVGLSAFALYTGADLAFATAGVAWLGAAAARIVSVTIDRARTRENLAGIVVELAIGGLLVA